MKTRILVGLCITVLVMLVAVLTSGAPVRVHVAEAAALGTGFTVPAFVVGRPRDVLARWKLVLPSAFLGALAWDIGAAATISKVDAFSLPAIYVVLPVATVLLLLVHGFVVTVATRGTGAEESPSNPEMQRTTALPHFSAHKPWVELREVVEPFSYDLQVRPLTAPNPGAAPDA